MRSSTTSDPDGYFRLLGPTFSRIILRRPHRVLLAAGEAHAAGSLFRSSQAGVVPEIAPIADEPEQPPVAEDEPGLGGLLVDEGEPAPEDPLAPAPPEQPQLVGAGAVHCA